MMSTPEENDADLALYLDMVSLLSKERSKERFIGGKVPEPNPDQVDRYFKQTTESEGFYVEDNLDVADICGRIDPCRSEDDLLYATLAAEFALEEYNRNEGMDLKLKWLVRANWQPVSGWNYFVTFEATDGLLYETKVYEHFDGEYKVQIFRHAKYHPAIESSSSSFLGDSE